MVFLVEHSPEGQAGLQGSWAFFSVSWNSEPSLRWVFIYVFRYHVVGDKDMQTYEAVFYLNNHGS